MKLSKEAIENFKREATLLAEEHTSKDVRFFASFALSVVEHLEKRCEQKEWTCLSDAEWVNIVNDPEVLNDDGSSYNAVISAMSLVEQKLKDLNSK